MQKYNMSKIKIFIGLIIMSFFYLAWTVSFSEKLLCLNNPKELCGQHYLTKCQYKAFTGIWSYEEYLKLRCKIFTEKK